MSHQESLRIKASVRLLPDVVHGIRNLIYGVLALCAQGTGDTSFPEIHLDAQPRYHGRFSSNPGSDQPEEKRIARVTSPACRAVSPLHHRFDETRSRFRRNSSRETVRTTGLLARLVFHVVCVIMVITKPTLGQGSIALPSLSDVR